ncbi:TELO2-interacting protein 2 [Aquarana catesbeiana]|uniref:TELO2-interacting protein 2 n=1 Tax=Aquarana catesbeiana TaxID=8400 RepID=UPI003CCA149D
MEEAAPAPAPGHVVSQALSELSSCLERSILIPRTPAGYAELFQAVVVWTAPGEDPVSQQKTPDRASAAVKAIISVLNALKATSRDKRTTSSTAGAGSAPLEMPGDLLLNKEVQLLSGKGNVPESPVTVASKPNKETACSSSGSTLDSSEVGSVDVSRVLTCVTAPLLLLCGAHLQKKPWTDSRSRSLAEQLLQTLLRMSECESVDDLLKGPNRQEPDYVIFREALGLLGPRLRKDTWESHPEAKIVFSWMLYQVPRPWLADFLGRVMPPSLLFSDDYKPENKVLGVQCLHHIIKNVPAADLRQYNRAMVVYHALRNHLYTTEVEVIEVVLPCLLDLFPVLHKPPPAVGSFQKDGENPSDQVMQLILTHMEMEHKIALRRLYACNLPALQERLGVRVVRHMKRLLRVIVGYLEVYDGPEETTRLCILDTLQGTIKYAWPRILPRLPLLVKALLKLMYEVSADPGQHSELVREALLHSATECLMLLEYCSKGQVKIALEGIATICKDHDMKKYINRVLQDAHQ